MSESATARLVVQVARGDRSVASWSAALCDRARWLMKVSEALTTSWQACQRVMSSVNSPSQPSLSMKRWAVILARAAECGMRGLSVILCQAEFASAGGSHQFRCLGRRSSKRIAKWFRASFHFGIGIVHFFDASRIAMKISFRAESRLGYCLRFRVNLRMTLFTDSMVFVV